LARRSLKPQLNQIRTWVRQGRTDAWIAHQLEVSVKDIGTFKREHDLEPAETAATGESDLFGPRVEEDEPDLRAEDEALVAAALEAEQDEPEDEGEDSGEDDEDAPSADADDGDSDAEDKPKRRRRGRRGGRGRGGGGGGAAAESGGGSGGGGGRSGGGGGGGGGRGRGRGRKALDGTFDHGEEGYGLWLDPGVQDDPVYAEHWKGHRPVSVTVEPDRIVITRSGDGD
jgi:hypothetical protein